MALTVVLLRAEAHRRAPLAEILHNVNRQLLEMNEANMFVTVLYGELNCSTRQFSYVRAGHEIPILMNRQGEFVDISKGGGMPLGLFDALTLDGQDIQLEEADTLLIYSDGVTDALNPQGEPFGKERLQNALREICHDTTSCICQSLLSRIQAFSADEPQYDDITLLSLRV
jgi:sigma-B regulation protein RsbU (phosphoserine phosphatase)